MKGRFITIEGADGAGKTTHADFIEHWLRQHGRDVVRTREPGGTSLGESIRNIVLDGQAHGISDEAELLLMFAARMQHLKEVIWPSLDDGKWVLSDRFTDASYAYQGGGRGIGEQRVEALEQWVQRGFEPDLTIVLDVPVEVGLSRTRRRNSSSDRFEQQARDFKEAVRQTYLVRAQRYPQRMHLVDADRPIEEVQRSLAALLEDFCRTLPS